MTIYYVMIDMVDRVGWSRNGWTPSKFSGRAHLDRKEAERELLEAEAAARCSKDLGDAYIKEEVITI